MTEKRNRTDGATGLQQIVSDAQLPPLKPPAEIKLSAEERKVWDVLVQGKARRGWLDQDLYMLSDLVRCQVRVEKYQRKASSLSKRLTDKSIKELASIEKLIDQLVRRSRFISVYLQLHPEATQGKSREQVGQNEAHQDARGQEKPSPSTDGLIPFPKKAQ